MTTTTNDKLRSLFLAALMVFSVFAMTVALPGSAAANHDTDEYSEYDADTHLNTDQRYWGQTVLVHTSGDVSHEYELWAMNNQDSDASPEFVRTLTVSDDDVATFSTDGLSGDYQIRTDGAEGTDGYPVEVNNGEIQSEDDTEPSDGDYSFSVTTQTLDAEFEDSNVNDEDEDVEVNIDTNRGSHLLNVSADGLDNDDLEQIFTDAQDENDDPRQGDFEVAEDENDDSDDTLVLESVSSGDYRTNFTGVDTGEYTFDFEAFDTEASSSASVNVSDAAEGDIQFANDVPQDQVGDIADITLEMDNTEQGTLTIGSEDQNYYLVADVEDGDEDGQVTVQFNTYEAGSYSQDDELGAEGSDDSATVLHEGGSFETDEAQDDLLDATEYDMNVTSGDNYDETEAHADAKESGYDDPSDVGSLSLQDRSTDNVTIMTAPEAFNEFDDENATVAGLGSNVTQANDIAEEDYAFVQIEATGLEGYLATLTDDEDFLNGDAATALLLEEAEPGANQDAVAIDWDDGDESFQLVNDGNNDTYYVAVDTEGEDAPDDDEFNFEADEEYSAEFSVLGSDGGDYAPDGYEKSADTGGDNVLNFHDDDENETVSGNFDVVEGETNFDMNEDDMILVEAADNQTVSGTTNWAPGSELTLSIESDDSTSPFLTRPDAEVQPDGTFNASADFSDLGEGTNLTISLSHLSEDFDEDGQVVAEDELPGETETETEDNGTETPTDTATPTDTDTPTDTEESPDDTETTEPTDDSGPGFTVIAALGALIAAALLAVRRNN